MKGNYTSIHSEKTKRLTTWLSSAVDVAKSWVPRVVFVHDLSVSKFDIVTALRASQSTWMHPQLPSLHAYSSKLSSYNTKIYSSRTSKSLLEQC
jgi:hypothetical protein